MPIKPDNLFRFWQELKRRRVIRVITVYAAAAFVILELTDIVAPSLGLPDWTLNLIIILLCVGFIIAVILSWIYDIHPEGGIVKTEPVIKISEETVQPSSSGWKVASYMSFVVIVGLIALNIIPRDGRSSEIDILDKSIAVLPFINHSPDAENEYFINGTMESILNNLFKIGDLKVISRSSVESYRDLTVRIPKVAEELDVNYILEGSMQKYGNQIRLTLQLIDRNDDHVWAEQYDRKITKVEEHLALQSEIAQLVAEAIKAVITPEEKDRIEKVSTDNLTAYDYYLHGREEHRKFHSVLFSEDEEALENARILYIKALEYDSIFALAWAGLAAVHYDIYNYYGNLSTGDLDLAALYADRAIKYDDEAAQAYSVKGHYKFSKGDFAGALKEFNQAIDLNPGDPRIYIDQGRLYWAHDVTPSQDLWRKAGKLWKRHL